MAAGTFPINLRDIRFVLFEQLGIERLCHFDPFKDFSREIFEMVLEEAAKLAREVLAPLNAISDREGCAFDGGRVRVPRGFHEAYRRYCAGGWIAATVEADAGGQGLPETVGMAAAEMFAGACCSFTTYPGLTRGAANLIRSFGTEEQKRLYLEKMLSGRWTGTMCLTEPQAGSSLGDVKTTAKREGNSYILTGTKIFITGGDQDLTENIIHTVLARTEGAPPGSRGLSLFIVPKIRVRPDGSLGEANDVVCSGLEHKMGIKGSSTAILVFGGEGGCRGEILGVEGQGLPLMFQMMNEARLGVALQGMALGGVAYLHALNYARERIQGVEIQNMKDPNAPRVPIIRHPDIRRMLMKMKAYTEGLRALLYRSALFADLAKASPDPMEREDGLNRIELLTPVCKAYAADVGFRLTEWAIQVFGGYGYCGDYPVEQLCRDVKITSIYEGTNGIQAMDLVGRKLALKKGALFLGWLKEIGEFIERHRAHSVFGPWTSRLEQAKNALVQVTGHFAKTAAEGDRLYPMLQAYPYLELFGDLEVARLLLEQALLSRDRLERAFSQAEATAPEAQARVIAGQSEAAYLHGKIQGAEFFISQILPRVQSTASAILSGDRSALEMPEGAF